MIIRKTTLALAVIALAGCSSTSERRAPDGGFAYTKVADQPPLTIPAGLHAPKGDGKYVIPPAADKGPVGKAMDIRAPRLVLTVVDGSRIAEDEAGSKVEIDAREGEDNVVTVINQRLDEWLKARNIPVASHNGNTIETDWFVPNDMEGMIKNADDFPVKRRFEIRVDAPQHARTAEVYVTSKGAERVAGDDNDATIGSGERASVAVLNDWLGFYASRDTAHAKEIALAKFRPIAVTLGKNSSDLTALVLGADFERAWSRVPMVLEHMGFEIKDIDKSLGTYFVSYKGDPDSSFWSGIFGGDDKELSIKHGKYQIQLGEMGDNTSMTITNDDGQPIPDDKYAEIYKPFSELMRDSDLKEMKN